MELGFRRNPQDGKALSPSRSAGSLPWALLTKGALITTFQMHPVQEAAALPVLAHHLSGEQTDSRLSQLAQGSHLSSLPLTLHLVPRA